MSKGKDKGKSFIDIGLLDKQIESFSYLYIMTYYIIMSNGKDRINSFSYLQIMSKVKGEIMERHGLLYGLL